MDEQALRGLIADVKRGKLSRRGFINRMIAVGLTAPFAAQMLTYSGVARAQTKPDYKPTKRGGGGPLKVLWWQGATLLNPHFAVGTKDQDGSRIFYEPLASWDPEGFMYPVLAAEIPDLENGGLSKDGKSVTWKLKPGVQWHDGKPFTADDVVFNWEYAKDPATAAVTSGTYQDIKVEKVDDLTVRVLFPKPTPFWADAFVGVRGMLIPKHHFDAYRGYGPGAVIMLRLIREGTPWPIAAAEAFDGQGSAGNGAAMRAAPLGAWHADSPARAAAQGARAAEVTHAHPEGIAGGVAVAVAAAVAAASRLGNDVPDLLGAVAAHTPDGRVRDGMLAARRITHPAEAAYELGTGSRAMAQDSVPFAIWVAARHLDDYAGAITACVTAGGDVDTTAAMAGGIVAARTGVAGIPARWLAAREPLPEWVAASREI